jgi:large subunit ribosomal protein L17
MRHNRKGRKLSRTNTHRRAMLRNMVTSLFEHERITTTVAKAKEARPVAERLITRARRGDLAARRIVSAYVRSEDVARKLMEDIAPRFATRPGGYTRIYRLGPRPGDAGQMGILELVERKIVKPAPKRDGTKKKTKGEVETAGDEGEEEAGGKAVKGKAAGKKAAATKPEKGKPEKAGEKSEAAEKRRALRDRSRTSKSAAHAKPTQAGRKAGGSSKSTREG